MKLIIQIPCYNEEKTLPVTIQDLPTEIEGIDTIEYLIINDGSNDKTVEVAHQCGVHHVVNLPQNKGLAIAFTAGIDACLRLGADIIVNTDGDNQYNGVDIEKLVKPILEQRAEVVVGDRQTDTIKHFSWLKKKLEKLGSWIVRIASRTNVEDATSGFRAYSREAAMRLFLINDFSYTLETLINAGRRKTSVISVPITTNEKLRDSRLFKSISNYILKSGGTIIRTFTHYKPLRIFTIMGLILFSIGFILGIRYLYFLIAEGSSGHIQSLILSAIFLLSGFNMVMIGLIADGISANRKCNEEILFRLKKMEYDHFSEENESGN